MSGELQPSHRVGSRRGQSFTYDIDLANCLAHQNKERTCNTAMFEPDRTWMCFICEIWTGRCSPPAAALSDQVAASTSPRGWILPLDVYLKYQMLDWYSHEDKGQWFRFRGKRSRTYKYNHLVVSCIINMICGVFVSRYYEEVVVVECQKTQQILPTTLNTIET